jgi:hypothetical protein
MYYDNDFIDVLEENLSVPGGDTYVKKVVISIGDIIKNDKRIYKSFGVYWWAMKEALWKYYPDKNVWFMNSYMDNLMKERAWHGSQFRTVLAAVYYHSQQDTYTSDHFWDDADGVEHDYTLFDENAGE